MSPLSRTETVRK